MKKTILVLIAVAITAFSATQVLAGRTHRGAMDGGYMGTMQNMTDEQVQAQQAFMTDTADLRQNLAAKRGEYRALMAGDNPSPKEAGRLAGEIAGLKNQLHEKAVAAGIPLKGRGMGQGMGMGMGMGDGPRKGQGNCNW